MIANLWNNWNWGGIGFFVVMGTLVFSSGWVTRRIGNWIRKSDAEKTWRQRWLTAIDAYRQGKPDTTVQAAIEAALERRAQGEWDQMGNRIESHNYRAPFHAVHQIDFLRSQMMVQGDGSIVARCAVQGCDEIVIIGRRLAQATVVEDGRMS
jgi:hypothetical protein